MFSLREIIEENGENYMELVRSGESIKELAFEMGYTFCENCNGWLERTEMAITSGMGDIYICENCLHHRNKNKTVQAAIKNALNSQNGSDVWDLKQYLK